MMDAGRQIVLLFLLQRIYNLPHLSPVTNAVVSLLTSKLAVTEAVGGGESRRERAVGTLCVCMWARVCTRVCAGRKEGRGRES